jgi:hypothetical protein
MSATRTAHDADWSTRANCRNRKDEFFPTDGEHVDQTRVRRICAACPVQRECLADVMRIEGNTSADTRYGIYAGLNGRQRHRLYKANPSRWTS